LKLYFNNKIRYIGSKYLGLVLFKLNKLTYLKLYFNNNNIGLTLSKLIILTYLEIILYWNFN